MPLQATQLFQALDARSRSLAGMLVTIDDTVTRWLAYVPATFPTFTSHAVDHSVRILENLSLVLFDDSRTGAGTVGTLSAMEMYILACSAYLHDAGMVVSDAEKIATLRSDDWRDWVQTSRLEQWQEVEAFRSGNEPPDVDLRNFLADRQLRSLMAEYFRRQHPERAAQVIEEHGTQLLGALGGDPGLRAAIQDICRGHGLPAADLLDDIRFPERRTIAGEQVNVRFLAILLRLGDLLDMETDRACPLLLAAAAPVSQEAAVHWSQYQRIGHRLVAPDRIEIRAECYTREEHRLLLDWCQWIVDDTNFATRTMAHAARHGGWVAPETSLTGHTPTIVIGRHADATYRLSDWRLEFDETEVFRRLITDAYREPLTFLRELLQNAADATRCRLYATGEVSSEEHPDMVPVDVANNYPLTITLAERSRRNDLYGMDESQQVVVVEDSGCGMTEEIITRFFLQVGRSFYRSTEFKRTFTFTPVSRFGLGFLSVFQVSDDVQVDTVAASRPAAGIRLVLTGPRNYVITETIKSRAPGTTIAVAMRIPVQFSDVVAAVTGWCRRLEFPIVIRDRDQTITVSRESAAEYAYTAPVVGEEAVLDVRSFPIVGHSGIYGELYLLAYRDENGERWDRHVWARSTYPQNHPLASVPPMPAELVSVAGFTVWGGSDFAHDRGNPVARLDVRRPVEDVPLSRELGPRRTRWIDGMLKEAWWAVISDHLATSGYAAGEDAWRYKQRLADTFHLPQWETAEGMIPLYVNGARELHAVSDVCALDSFWICYSLPTAESVATPDADVSFSPAIHVGDLTQFADSVMDSLFDGRAPVTILNVEDNRCAIEWSKPSEILWVSRYRPIALISFAPLSIFGVGLHKAKDSIYGQTVINLDNEWGGWLARLSEFAETDPDSAVARAYHRLLTLLRTPLDHGGYELELVKKFLEGWHDMPGISEEFEPPAAPLERHQFRDMRHPWQDIAAVVRRASGHVGRTPDDDGAASLDSSG